MAKLTEEDQQLIERVVDVIVRWHMSVPAIFFLEMSKPLSFVGSQFMVLMGPLLTPFFPSGAYDRLAALLADRDNLETLLCLIESKERERHD